MEIWSERWEQPLWLICCGRLVIIVIVLTISIFFKPECVEDHGEEDKLAKEGDDEGGGWDDLGKQEEEHCQGEQDGDGQGDLVAKCG